MDGGPVEVVIGVGNSGPFVQNLGARHGRLARHGLEEDLDHGLSLCASQSVSQSAFVHDEPLLEHRQQEQDLHPDRQTRNRHASVLGLENRKEGRLLKRPGPKGRLVRLHDNALIALFRYALFRYALNVLFCCALYALCRYAWSVSCLQRRKKTTKGHRVRGEKEVPHTFSHARTPWTHRAP